MLALGWALAWVGAPLQAQAQARSDPLRRVAVFSPGEPDDDDALGEPFFDEMTRLGWIEGQNIVYDRVHGADRMAQLPRLAAELVARKPDLIYAAGPPTATAVKRATATIPVVFSLVVDPLAAGLVSSYAHPGGNVTGVTQALTESLMPKRLELLRELLPGVARIGVLGNPAESASRSDQEALAPVVARLGMTMIVANAADPAAFEAAVGSLIDQRVQAILPASSIAITRRAWLAEVATRAHVPVVGLHAPMARSGALFSYGPSFAQQMRRAAYLVDRILRGAKPGQTPVEAASTVELVVNRRSARALGVAIPRAVLLRADEVIE